MWLVGAAVVGLILLVLYLRSSGAPAVSASPSAGAPPSGIDPALASAFSTVAQGQISEEIASLQAQVEQSRIAAALAATENQNATQGKIAALQTSAQTTNNVISTIGQIFAAGIPYAFGKPAPGQGSSGGQPVPSYGGGFGGTSI